MESGPVQAFLAFLKADASLFLSNWYAVIVKGPRAFDSVDLNQPKVLAHALRFIFYIALFSFMLEVPIAAALKIPYEKPAYVATYLLLNCVLWLGYATALHTAMRVMGGRGELRQSLAIFCFSTALFVPIMVLQWPTVRHVIPNFGRFDEVSPDFIKKLPTFEAVTFWGATLLAALALIYFFYVVIEAMRVVHRLPSKRVLPASLIGLLGVVAIVVFLSYPIHKLLYSAFA